MVSELRLPEGKEWLFVAGVDRGGTTITTRVLNTHPEISVDIERSIVVRCRDLIETIWHNRIYPVHQPPYPAIPEDLDTIASIWERSLLTGVFEYYGARSARFVGDKIPWYTNRLSYLRQTYVGARFILNWREPLGTIASWKCMPWRQHLTLEEMVAAYNGLTDQILEASAEPDTLILRHDFLMTNPSSAFGQVARFLKIPSTFDFSMVKVQPPRTLPCEEAKYIISHAKLLPTEGCGTESGDLNLD